MDHRFKVERWSNNGQSVERELAVWEDIMVARAAFYAAVKEWPDKRFTLRQRTRVLLEHSPAQQ